MCSACGGSTDSNEPWRSSQGGAAGSGAQAGSAGTGVPGGAAGSGAQAGSAGTGMSGGAAGAGAESGTAGSGGGSGHSCARTTDRARVAVERAGQARIDCSTLERFLDPEPPTVLEGAITRVEANMFEIETCPPTADCPVSLVRFEVEASGLSLSPIVFRPGALVRVKYRLWMYYACEQSFEVSAIASWGGVRNPFQPTNALLLAIGDVGSTFEDSPYRIDRQPLGCRPANNSACAPDEYALVLTPTAAPDSSFRVGMGESKVVDLLQGPVANAWLIRNLRSYQSDICDDYGNFAWYVVYHPPTL